ncbi:2,3-bisphosphoglycerate-dependent phosphoglycerate mutase [Nigerium massiliense]|uniref:2,3-bisphosphoglycerate-dependent phosphoglycerate mutase n=1 Tax=Nigerium massiliense TaxID=1522317 RepID=UPI00058BC826|nr:2,3-bisphosphoglycerate-dependent phosphoglycerate mutase [Nigerium massiliense]
METARGTLILLRHGESTFNATKTFTGLLDADLTPAGAAQVGEAARLVAEAGLTPSILATSPMRRALRTTTLFMDALGLAPARAAVTWRLSERDYGCLTGVPKAEARRRYGEDAFFTWRRTLHGRPPAASEEQRQSWTNPPPVADHGPLTPGQGESLADVVERVRPLWEDVLAPQFRVRPASIAVVAHGNSLRALCAIISGLSETETEELNIPAGHPLVFDVVDGAVQPRSGVYLDAAIAHAAAAAVAAEGGT